MPLTRAREVANDARKTAANGGTPLAPKAGCAGTERKAKSYGEVVEVYSAERLTSLRTGPATRTTLQRIGRELFTPWPFRRPDDAGCRL